MPAFLRNPNQSLYAKYQQHAVTRGLLLHHILMQRMQVKGARILDLGCGTGGTAIALARAGADVLAVDFDANRIKQLEDNLPAMLSVKTAVARAEDFRAKESAFDAVILLDVIEHVDDPQQVLLNAHRMLANDGWLYLSTPNRFSPLNILCDPHYSLPIVALLNRRTIKRIVADLLHWHRADKKDFAQLFSFSQLTSLLEQTGFCWHFVNKQAISFALTNPQCLWSRSSHLLAIRLFKKTNLDKFLLRAINDEPGFFNKWLNSAWFIMAQRKTW